MKNYLKTLAFVAVVSMAGMSIAVADQWDKKTIITTDEVMQLPNMMLQPGTYVIKLADSSSNRHIVQFFDKDEKHLVTTVLAIPNQRLRLTGRAFSHSGKSPPDSPKRCVHGFTRVTTSDKNSLIERKKPLPSRRQIAEPLYQSTIKPRPKLELGQDSTTTAAEPSPATRARSHCGALRRRLRLRWRRLPSSLLPSPSGCAGAGHAGPPRPKRPTLSG
jgi:hypothetical protein